MEKQAKKAYSGGMSQGSRKRLAKSITVLTQSVKPKRIFNPVSKRPEQHKFSFITLTIGCNQIISARYAYDKLLGPFLDWLTKTIGAKNPLAKTYIWKLEYQLRGQPHYHFLTPAWIHWRKIRAKWNDLQRKAGLLDEYAKKHKHFDPNSTDVHKTLHIKKIDRYMVKELCKTVDAHELYVTDIVDSLIKAGEIPEDKRKEFIAQHRQQVWEHTGKVWGCSADLAGASYYTIALTRAHERKINAWVDQGKAWRHTGDFFEIIYCDNADPPDILNTKEKDGFEYHLQRVTGKMECPELSTVVAMEEKPVDTVLSEILKAGAWQQTSLEW